MPFALVAGFRNRRLPPMREPPEIDLETVGEINLAALAELLVTLAEVEQERET